MFFIKEYLSLSYQSLIFGILHLPFGKYLILGNQLLILTLNHLIIVLMYESDNSDYYIHFLNIIDHFIYGLRDWQDYHIIDPV